jgi:tetratricopeptide (TPR) repeat protein/DNA-binding CsgD family transcriptional regulator
MSKIQKLENKLKLASGLEKVELLDDLAYSMYGSNPEKSKQYASEALDLAQKLDFKKGIARSNLIIGITNLMMGNHVEAMQHYSEALAVYEEVGDDHGIAASLRRMGLIYWRQSNFDLAMEYYLKALDLREKIGDKDGIAESYNDIAYIHISQEEYDKCLEFLHKALDIRQEIGDKHGIAICFNRMGVAHLDQGHYQEALDYLHRALKIREELKELQTIWVVDLYSNFVSIYLSTHEFDKALETHLKALKISREIGYKEGMIFSYLHIGFIRIQLHQYDAALESLNEGIRLSKEVGLKERERDGYKYLAQLYEMQGNYEEAYQFYQQYATLKQDLFREKQSKKITNLQTWHELERNKRDAEIYRLKNVELAKEITERELAQNELNKYKDHLEELVQERTTELEQSYEQLEKKNIALSQVLEHLEKQRQSDQLKIYKDVEEALVPFMKRLQLEMGTTHERSLRELDISLNAILAKDKDEFNVRFTTLTSRESELCEMIKKGLTSKQMSDNLNLSLRTIEKHREQIRKKLGLANKDINLATYLRSH